MISVRDRFNLFFHEVKEKLIAKHLSPHAAVAQKKLTTIVKGAFVEHLIIGPIKENVAEFGGGVVGSYAGATIIPALFASSMRSLGLVAGITGLAVATTSVATSSLFWRNADTAENIKKMVMTAVITYVVTSALFAALPHLVDEAGRPLAAETGEIIGGVMGQILGGFVAVKMTGSQEVLWNIGSPVDSYTYKSLQTLTASLLCDRFGLQMATEGLVKFATGMMMDCLSYNALDITAFVRKFYNKQTLDGVLPSKIDVQALMSDQTINAIVQAQTMAVSLNYPIKMVESFNQASQTVQAIKKLQEVCAKEIVPFSSELILLFDTLSSNAKNATELLGILEPLIKLSPNQFVACILNTFNTYSAFIKNSPELSNLHGELDLTLRLYSHEKNEEKKAKLLQKLNSIKDMFSKQMMENNPTVGEFVKTLEDLKIPTNSLIALLDNLVNESLSRGQISLTGNRSADNILTKKLLHHGRSLIQEDSRLKDLPLKAMLTMLDVTSSNIADHLYETILQWEEKIIGHAISSPASKIWMKETLTTHMPYILILTLKGLADAPSTTVELDTKQLYLNINSGLWSYLHNTLPARLTKGMEHIFASQIENAALT